ncbi:MAG: hypothetical protein PHP95_06675 [Desulfuromonadaceae bacterium]|nr:hypothetical protein [Desulfuromonadaceae bacterium]MDD2848125.1 hypothetical protein [Desulfuromonadaceae bacterium]MDD4132034.1 hypothetical protein [Desulfuromonadaceae bacterium]
MSMTEDHSDSVDAINGYSDTPEKQAYHDGYCNPAEMAARILEETPEAINAFDSLEELIAYIREAMAADYIYCPKALPEG